MANAIYGYTVVSYPESMPEDWQERLVKLPFGYCYALHDNDFKLDVDTGEVIKKKAHIHFYFQNNPSAKQKRYIHESLCVNFGQPVRNASAMFDYLTHENDVSKTHYSKDIIVKSAKWDEEMFEMQYMPKVDYEGILHEVISQHDITEYSELIDYLMKEEYSVVERKGIMQEAKKLWVMRYIDSLRNARKTR